MLSLGASVIVTARSQADVDATVAEFAALHGEGRAHGCACDVATPDGRRMLVDAAGAIADARGDGGGALDALVNNVGCNMRKPIGEATGE